MDHLQFFLKGLFDSLKGTTAIFYIYRDAKQRQISTRQSPPKTRIRQRVSNVSDKKVQRKPVEETDITTYLSRCIILNGGIYLLVVLLFDYIVYPLLRSESGNAPSNSNIVANSAAILYDAALRIPLFIISRLTNVFCFQYIADNAFPHPPAKSKGLSDVIITFADLAFNLFIESLFFIQASITSYLPIYGVGNFLSLLQFSLLYSLYMFEYKWCNMGWELHKRLTCIEVNWSYFIGFGLPLALATSWSENFVISGCIFALLFPFFIISATVTTPVHGPSSNRIPAFSLVVGIGNGLFKTVARKKK